MATYRHTDSLKEIFTAMSAGVLFYKQNNGEYKNIPPDTGWVYPNVQHYVKEYTLISVAQMRGEKNGRVQDYTVSETSSAANYTPYEEWKKIIARDERFVSWLVLDLKI